MSEPPTNLPEVQAIYNRDFARNPRRTKPTDGVFEVDRAIMFGDGDVMLFITTGEGEKATAGPGIVLTRDAIWALKARA